MVSKATLDKAISVQELILKARRLCEDLKDIEQGEWLPGHGPKPHRMSELAVVISRLNSINQTLDQLWD